MDQLTVNALRALNNDFYRVHHVSFSRTRQHYWEGWRRITELMGQPPVSALDVACGNMRFNGFLEERYGKGTVAYHGVDSCAPLVPGGLQVRFQQLDIVDALMEGRLADRIEAPPCDLVACFGFMHHVPTNRLRERLLGSLLDKASSGGIAAVSFWQFANDGKVLSKARETTARGCAEHGLVLDEGDYLLGWEGVPGAYRYCHSFTDDEVECLADSISHRARIVGWFKADGKTGNSNCYLAVRPCPFSVR